MATNNITPTLGGIKIGWDIGIKNMSYCRLQPITTNGTAGQMKNIITIGPNSYHIVGWEIINVVPKINQFIHDQGEVTLESRPIVKCCAPKTTKSKKAASQIGGASIESCGKPATHCLVNDPSIGYCNTHYTANAPANPLETVEILPTSCRCWHHETSTGTSTGASGQSNSASATRCQTGAVILNARNPYIGYCRKHTPSCGLPVGDQLKIIRNRKVASLDLTMLAAALYDELDARPDILHADDVLLENQPVLKNPTMKTMQTFLYSYYVIHGVQRPPNKVKTVGDIHCYCASNKLDIIKILPVDAATDILRRVKEVKSGYSRNKKMAVYICQYLLDHGTGCEDLAIKFADKKKQDDLADSLLMTLHFFERAGLTKLRAGEAKTRAKATKSGAPISDSGVAPDERQDLLAELLPKRGGGKAKLAINTDTNIGTNICTMSNSPSTIITTQAASTNSKKTKTVSKSNVANNILTQLAGKISINLDSPTVSDSSLSDVD